MFHTVSSLQMPYAPREWSSDIRTRMLLTKPVGIRDLPLLKSKTHVDSVTLSPHVADPVPNSNLSDAPGARKSPSFASMCVTLSCWLLGQAGHEKFFESPALGSVKS